MVVCRPVVASRVPLAFLVPIEPLVASLAPIEPLVASLAPIEPLVASLAPIEPLGGMPEPQRAVQSCSCMSRHTHSKGDRRCMCESHIALASRALCCCLRAGRPCWGKHGVNGLDSGRAASLAVQPPPGDCACAVSSVGCRPSVMNIQWRTGATIYTTVPVPAKSIPMDITAPAYSHYSGSVDLRRGRPAMRTSHVGMNFFLPC
jgi:hypothetical protein